MFVYGGYGTGHVFHIRNVPIRKYIPGRQYKLKLGFPDDSYTEIAEFSGELDDVLFFKKSELN